MGRWGCRAGTLRHDSGNSRQIWMRLLCAWWRHHNDRRWSGHLPHSQVSRPIQVCKNSMIERSSLIRITLINIHLKRMPADTRCVHYRSGRPDATHDQRAPAKGRFRVQSGAFAFRFNEPGLCCTFPVDWSVSILANDPENHPVQRRQRTKSNKHLKIIIKQPTTKNDQYKLK